MDSGQVSQPVLQVITPAIISQALNGNSFQAVMATVVIGLTSLASPATSGSMIMADVGTFEGGGWRGPLIYTRDTTVLQHQPSTLYKP